MLIDRYSGQHKTSSPQAVSAFEDAVFAVAAHRPAGEALQRALAHDPELVSAHVLKGFGAVILGRAETNACARDIHTETQRLADGKGRLTDSEKALVESLGLAVAGQFAKAADRLDAHLDDHPAEFLCAKISHALRFMLGERDAMLAVTRRLSTRFPRGQAGYGFLLGCHAFALEECGHYADAEAAGLSAVALEPADSWGLHAVSHVHEMTGRTDEGEEWLDRSRPVWSRCNNFSFHMAWHLALFLLEKGDHAKVLDVYDREIRPVQTDDFRDMANAVSTLWRLEQEGVDVGDRWDGLAAIAARRSTDMSYIFASLHYLLALLAVGDFRAAQKLVEDLREKASGGCDQSRVAKRVGLPAAEAIVALSKGGGPRGDLAAIARDLPALGGSHAQRDVFLRTMMVLAEKARHGQTFDAIAGLRRAQRHEDRFQRLMRARMDRRPGPAAAPIFASHAVLLPFAKIA